MKRQTAAERRKSRKDRRNHPRKSGGKRQNDQRPYGVWSKSDWKTAMLYVAPVTALAGVMLVVLIPGPRATFTFRSPTPSAELIIPRALAASDLSATATVFEAQERGQPVPKQKLANEEESLLPSPGKAWLPNPSLLTPAQGPALDEDTAELLPDDDFQIAVKNKAEQPQ